MARSSFFLIGHGIQGGLAYPWGGIYRLNLSLEKKHEAQPHVLLLW